MNALADVAKDGLARAVGISNCNPEQMRRAHGVLSARGVPLACNEVEFSLLKRGPEKSGLLSLCHELGATLIAYRPLASGVLVREGTGEADTRLRPLIDAVKRIGESHGRTPSQVAVNWVICKGALPIPGASNARHAQENAGALGWRLSAAEVAELDSPAPPIVAPPTSRPHARPNRFPRLIPRSVYYFEETGVWTGRIKYLS